MSARLMLAAVLAASALTLPVQAQAPAPATAKPLPPGQTAEPFKQPIAATEGVITVRLREFASLPDIENIAARAMTLAEEPGTRRLFVSDMRGPLYSVSMDGKTVTPYLEHQRFGISVQSVGRERGVQSIAFHPQFAQVGAPGYGKFYTYSDVVSAPAGTTAPAADFTAPQPATTHDTVLLEWTAKTATAAVYDGGAPRELMRWRQPFANHNGGHMAFNPLARPGTREFGLLYIGVGDGGSGGDPLKVAQNLTNGFGKILRIDPLGRNSRNGKYGIPASNPFAARQGVLGEIYAYGIRNTQFFSWDPRTGTMYMSDIGQNIVEKVSTVPAGGNLGWNIWEGSYRYVSRDAVVSESPRSDPRVTYPIAEWDQIDPVLLPTASGAAVGGLVYRGNAVPQLRGRLLFGDMPSGELFHVSADNPPRGGQDPIRRVLFTTEGNNTARPLLAIVQEKNKAQGKTVATRTDMRFYPGAAGQIYVLNKADGTIRVIER